MLIKINGIEQSTSCDLGEDKASVYASERVSEFDRELSIDLAGKDMEYETMKELYESMLKTLNAKKENEKNAVSTAAQDTGLIGGN